MSEKEATTATEKAQKPNLEENALLKPEDFLEDDEVDQQVLAEEIAILIHSCVGRLEQQKFIGAVTNYTSKLRTSNTKVSPERKAEAVINILDEVSQLTPTNADNAIVSVARVIFNIVTGNAPVAEFFARIASRIQERRAKRRERRQARRAERNKIED